MIDTFMHFLQGWFAISVGFSAFLVMLGTGLFALCSVLMVVYTLVVWLWSLLRGKS